MAKEYAERFYRSKAWRECRAAFFKHKHGLCNRCGAPGKIVHHIKEITPRNIDDPDITLSWSNLELLCQDCHTKHHMSQHSPLREGLAFDGDGNLIQRE